MLEQVVESTIVVEWAFLLPSASPFSPHAVGDGEEKKTSWTAKKRDLQSNSVGVSHSSALAQILTGGPTVCCTPRSRQATRTLRHKQVVIVCCYDTGQRGNCSVELTPRSVSKRVSSRTCLACTNNLAKYSSSRLRLIYVSVFWWTDRELRARSGRFQRPKMRNLENGALQTFDLHHMDYVNISNKLSVRGDTQC